MRNLKIVLSVLFVLAVGFLVVRSCVHPRLPFRPREERPHVFVQGKAPKIKAAVFPAAGLKQVKMAIILDDWGNSRRLLSEATEIGRPVTLSILPHLPFSRQIASEAKAKGLGVMLHLPMQPKGDRAVLEPHTILTTMPDADIRSSLDSALESVPGAEGVNNHQGSAATSDLRVMRIVLGELGKRNLFFIDSNVVSTSVGSRVAKETGIRFTKRDIFIDNEMTPETIRKQLERAKGIALKRGGVVVIGHDKELTLKTIQAVAPEFEKEGIQFVLVKDILERDKR